MKKTRKFEIMDKTTYDLNEAKERIARSSRLLEAYELTKDAEDLMKIVYKIEAIQNKYNQEVVLWQRKKKYIQQQLTALDMT